MIETTLYEITERFKSALAGIEINEETGEILNCAGLDGIQAEFDEKAESIGLYIKNLSAMAEAIKNEQEALNKRRKTVENKIVWLKSYLLSQLSEVGRNKFETSKVKITTTTSEQTIITDETIIPKDFLKEKTTYEPDKKAIKENIKAGIVIPGAEIKTNVNINIK